MSQDTLDLLPREARSLSLGESFGFSCTRCGECCFDQLVLLDPLDVFYLSRHLGWTSTRLFAERHVELIECDGEWRCSLVMPALGRGTKCRFLEPNLTDEGVIRYWGCSLHGTGAKPLVCLSSPLASDTEGNLYLVAPVPSCPGMNRGELQRVSEYIAEVQIEPRQDFSRRFQRVRPTIKSKEEALLIYDFDREEIRSTVEALESYLWETE